MVNKVIFEIIHVANPLKYLAIFMFIENWPSSRDNNVSNYVCAV
jgi:hypothetical protein